jgi:tight adherence protein B
MDLTVLLVIFGGLLVVVVLLIIYLLAGSSKGQSLNLSQRTEASDSLRALVTAQRDMRKDGAKGFKDNLALAAAAENRDVKRKSTSSARLTLDKKLRYAQWIITPVQFRAIQVVATLMLWLPVYLVFDWMIWGFALFITPLMVDGVLDFAINRRFKAFDRDYPVLLMSYVGLLKTGMNTITGLEAAARGLDENSLVRAEVELMLERLRMGLTEEQAINAFGEDIAHPELELFVQSLILNRRLGGTLSATLERLAQQVRKRQQFRQQAISAVAMERGSIYMIAAIMSALMAYLMISSPELVFPAWEHELGKTILQSALVMILGGFYWSRQVTKIRV